MEKDSSYTADRMGLTTFMGQVDLDTTQLQVKRKPNPHQNPKLYITYNSDFQTVVPNHSWVMKSI